MTRTRFCLASFGTALCLAMTPAVSGAQAQPPRPGTAAAPARPSASAPRTPQPIVRTVTESQDARQTRAELREVLDRYSPALGGVLKLDPTLLTNPDYLGPYAGLAEFLASHPEVARDPAYFFEDVEVPFPESRRIPLDAREQTVRMWSQTMEATLFFVAFLVVTATLTWLIKTLIDYRRWSRLSKVQADVHNKVLDRFANNDELLAYVQTPAGRRFLESAPIALDPAAPAVAAPLRRILFALEAGLVIMAGGIGLQYVSGHVPAEISPMLLSLGVLGVALGIGFVVAAGASFFVSRRMGLFTPPPAAAVPERLS